MTSIYRGAACPACEGTGKVTCPECGGLGRIRCELCKGTVERWVGEGDGARKVRCSCETGVYTCGLCNGGTGVCGVCNGTGLAADGGGAGGEGEGGSGSWPVPGAES